MTGLCYTTLLIIVSIPKIMVEKRGMLRQFRVDTCDIVFVKLCLVWTIPILNIHFMTRFFCFYLSTCFNVFSMLIVVI